MSSKPQLAAAWLLQRWNSRALFPWPLYPARGRTSAKVFLKWSGWDQCSTSKGNACTDGSEGILKLPRRIAGMDFA